MQTKYRVLRIIIMVYQIIAIVLLGLGFIGGIFIMVAPTLSFQITGTDVQPVRGTLAVNAGITIIIAGFILSLCVFTFAQLIEVFIDIEANTRPKNVNPPRDGIQRLPR